MAGRPRKPAQLKIVQGTFQKSRNPENEPEFTALGAIPKPPKTLSKHGKALWKKLMPELAQSGVVTNADLPAFEMLCGCYGRWALIREHLEQDVLQNLKNEFGGRAAAAVQMNAEFAMCVKLMAQFGLTPSDRNRLGLSKKKEDDPDTARMKELLGA